MRLLIIKVKNLKIKKNLKTLFCNIYLNIMFLTKLNIFEITNVKS